MRSQTNNWGKRVINFSKTSVQAPCFFSVVNTTSVGGVQSWPVSYTVAPGFYKRFYTSFYAFLSLFGWFFYPLSTPPIILNTNYIN